MPSNPINADRQFLTSRSACPLAGPQRRAFTLVELLVVIGVIAVLLSITIPALSKARSAARNVATTAQLREITSMYVLYAQNNRGALLPGFLPNTVRGQAPSVSDPFSLHTFTGRTARMWSWRLAESAGNSRTSVFSILRPTLTPAGLPQRSDSATAAESKAYAAALYPVFGLNTVFLGGHARSTLTSVDFFQGFNPDGTPSTADHVARKLTDVGNASRQIVFVETAIQRGSRPIDADDLSGFHYVFPPRADRASGVYWTAAQGKVIVQLPATPARTLGVPYTRSGKSARIPTAFLDGHVDSLSPMELTDMRLWTSTATRQDFDF